MGRTRGGRGEENIGNYSNAVAFFSGELSKKRKLEEQLNLPSAKHNVRLNPGNSEGESLSLGCCTDEDRDARRSFYCVKQFGQEGGMVDPAVVNGSTVLTFNRASIDTHVDAQPCEYAGGSIARKIEAEDAIFTSFVSNVKSSKYLMQSGLFPADETYSACSSGNSCISEYSKHICYEISCSPNQSCRPPGSRSCSSVGHSTTLGDGLDHSKCSPHYLDCKANEKTTSDDSDRLCGSLEEFIFEKENLYSHRSHLKNNQFNRLSSRKSAVQANECHAMGLLGKDGTGADSGQPIVSAYTPSIVKRHKAIKTSEFGSGSTSDEHGGCPREQSQLTVLGDIHSSFETCTRPNASVCNPENTVAQYGSTEAVITYTDIYEEQDANTEAYLERSIPDTDIMPDTGETLPLFVLSSGRETQNKDARTSSRPPTIDKDFEQYFSMLML